MTSMKDLFRHERIKKVNKGEGKVFYGLEPPSGEPTTTVRGINYQVLAAKLQK